MAIKIYTALNKITGLDYKYFVYWCDKPACGRGWRMFEYHDVEQLALMYRAGWKVDLTRVICPRNHSFEYPMPNKIFGKYNISRADGRDAENEKHANCEYFVIDLNHDVTHGRAAILAYAHSIKLTDPALAHALEEQASKMYDTAKKIWEESQDI